MYQVLYRKYRPKVFSDVVGQEHITDTLLNELRSSRLAHAYLFTGSRGTGKTTCAKILAKAVNCEHPVDGNPCNECEICKGIDNGSIFDVVEIDAASNNGVDNIRDLREEANFTPGAGKYRVYIIDEVHMLSVGAFNALLKTLEEPPEHVKFILATTEIHKIPATILSRCQRFDFRRINSEAMVKRMKYIAEQEKFTITDDGAMMIARLSDGGMRDALSLLDQCVGRGEIIDAKLVSKVSGIADKSYLYDLTDCVLNCDASTALSTIDSLHNSSCDMERLCIEMINHLRNMLVVRTVKNSRQLVVCTDDEYERVEAKAKEFTIEKIIYTLDLFQKSLENIKAGANRRTEMEMTFIKLCDASLETSNSALLARISALENAVKYGVKVNTITPVQPSASTTPLQKKAVETSDSDEKKAEKPVQNVVHSEPNDEKTFDLPNTPVQPQHPVSHQEQEDIKTSVEKANTTNTENVSADGDTPFPLWHEVMKRINEINPPLYGVLSGSSAVRRGEFLLIDSPNTILKTFLKQKNMARDIRQSIYDVTGEGLKIGLFRRSESSVSQPSAPQNPLDRFADLAKTNGIDVEIK